MANYKEKAPSGLSWKKVVAAVLSVAAVVACVGGVAAFTKSETKPISSLAFSRGDVNALGNFVDSKTSIATKIMFECVGLEITPDEEAEVEYEVFYYDANKSFLKSSGVQTDEYVNDYAFAKYARIVITPTGAETKEDNFKIGMFDVGKYANMLTITVDREQSSIWTEVKVPVGANNRIRDCIYTGEYWVMVGVNGQLTYSTDAKQWVKSDIDADGQTVSVAYGNGKYVVVDYDNGIYVSDKVHNGYSCKLEVKNLGHVVYSGTEFLVVGKEGMAYTSTDGETWTALSKFTNNDLTSLIYVNNQYVAAGQNGAIFTSTDLNEWYDYSVKSVLDDIRVVYYDGTSYFIGGYEGEIYVSSDLNNWVEATHTSTSDIRYVRDIVVHDGSLFAAAYTSGAEDGEIWVSEDAGLTWNVVLKADCALWICESADGKLVVGGDNGRIFILE